MKKQILLVSALILLSTQAMASGTGYVRTGVETGIEYNQLWDSATGDKVDYNYTTWTLAEGYFKGSNWGNYSLGYVAKKSFNESSKDHDGAMKIELAPAYGKSASWGYFGGEFKIVDEKWDSMDGGTDTIKPKVFATININNKSRIETKAMYALSKNSVDSSVISKDFGVYSGSVWANNTVETTTNDGKSEWMEAEIQYKHDLLGGTAGAGVYYAQNTKDKYTVTKTSTDAWGYSSNPEITEKLSEKDNYNRIDYLLNYAKYLSPIKTYASLYGAYRLYDYKYEVYDYNNATEKKEYQIGLYLNHDFKGGFAMDAELKRTADITTSVYGKIAENSYTLGLKYNF